MLIMITKQLEKLFCFLFCQMLHSEMYKMHSLLNWIIVGISKDVLFIVVKVSTRRIHACY